MSFINEFATRYDLPHSVVMDCFQAILRWHIDGGSLLSSEGLDGNLVNFFTLNGEHANIMLGFEYAENYLLMGSWNEGMLDPDDEPVNGIPEFPKGSRYVAYISSTEWFFWGDSGPYDFPAVAYSPSEIRAWFVWSCIRFSKLFPACRNDINSLMERHVDVQAAITAMHERLDGRQPWEFGPARIHEPHFDLWHQKTRDKKMNDWLRQCMD